MDQYCKLTDNIQSDIMHFEFKRNIYLDAINGLNLNESEKNKLREHFNVLQTEMEKSLHEAKNILTRIEKRMLYKYINQTIVLDQTFKIDDAKQTQIKAEVFILTKIITQQF